MAQQHFPDMPTSPISPRKVNLVGSRIRELRKGHRLTQMELSERIGVAQSDLSRMEQGEYKVGLDTLFKLLQVFDLKIGEFFGEADTRGTAGPRARGRDTAASPTRRGRRSGTSSASRRCRKQAPAGRARRKKKSEKPPAAVRIE